MGRILVLRVGLALVAVVLLTACAAVLPAPTVAAGQLAPGGTLRAAINYGNPLLATRDANGEPRGVSVDLARELARRLGVPLEMVTYTAAGKVVEGIKSDAWDVGFFAIDPVRAADTDFTAPYLIIEGAYLVPEASPIRRNEDVDRAGVRVAAARGSAYDLYLTRALKQATLVHAPTSQAVTDTMLAQKLDVAAGVRQQMQADARRLPGLRLLDGRFMEIRQAMAVPKGRAAGAAYLRNFVEEMKAKGFIAESLRRHGVEGAMLANPVASALAPPVR
jgi:polar amino acid transport system substrate-binding protein